MCISKMHYVKELVDVLSFYCRKITLVFTKVTEISVIHTTSTCIRIFWNPQLFLHGFTFGSHVSSESSMRIHNFLNPLSGVEIFEYVRNPEETQKSGRSSLYRVNN